MISREDFYKWLLDELLHEIDDDFKFFSDLQIDEFEIELFTYKFMDKFELDMSDFNYKEYREKIFKRNKHSVRYRSDLYEMVLSKKWI